MDDNKKFSYTVDNNVDIIVEEQQNQFTALRAVRWGDREPTLEIRRWRNQPDGSEFPLKGCTFMTEDGPSTLTEALASLGYGKTINILNSIKDRRDFRKSLNSVLGKEDEYYDESAGEADDEYYDPSKLLEI